MRNLVVVGSHDFDTFLAPFIDTEVARYTQAHWLGRQFEKEVWRLDVDGPMQIDWRVIVGKSLLTSKKHRRLWHVLRCWLVVQSHPDVTGGKEYAPAVLRQVLCRTLAVIDYFLLRAETLKIADHGLECLSGGDIKAMLATVASSSSIVDTLYDWPARLTASLRYEINSVVPTALRDVVARVREVECAIPLDDVRLTSLTDSEIVLARAWLWFHDYYLKGREHQEFYMVPSLSALASRIYSNTLWGRQVRLRSPKELCLRPGEMYGREYEAASVQELRGDRRMSERQLRRYSTVTVSLQLLHDAGLAAPEVCAVDLASSFRTHDLKGDGRTRTLPCGVVFGAVRVATEFALQYGDALLDSYVSIAQAASSSGQRLAVYCNANPIAAHISPSAAKLGIQRWTVEDVSKNPVGTAGLSKEEYFAALRQNVGLYECIQVLFGATQIIIGTTSARRIGELIDLRVENCLDASRTRIVFANRKSGEGGRRETISRPIPPLAVSLIEMLARFQEKLVVAGLIDTTMKLFSYPPRLGDTRLTNAADKNSYCRSIDFFCDWAQMPLDRRDRRYYFRQHQLRRFFAMLFFWGGGFGTIDSLRWFLGHTDASHVWNYITEITPGAALRSVAASWAAYSVRHATPEARELAAELQQHFGTGDFSVLEEDVLNDYIELLLKDGQLVVEPQFLDQGSNYRIAILLKPKSGADAPK